MRHAGQAIDDAAYIKKAIRYYATLRGAQDDDGAMRRRDELLPAISPARRRRLPSRTRLSAPRSSRRHVTLYTPGAQ